MIQIKVLNDYQSVMFTADINDDWVHILTMRDLVKPFMKKITLVEPGTGNEGKNLEYHVIYDGYYVTWETFRSIGDEAQ